MALLTLESDFSVVGEVERGDEIVPRALELRPDVALIDVDLPGLDGICAAAMLREQLPDCRLLILTGLGEPGTLRRALDAGVHGYLLKDTQTDELTDAIRTVARGERLVDTELALAAWDAGDSPLTVRESGVLRLVAEGMDAREIASRLSLSTGTVRNYLTSIVTKLNARNRVDALRIARHAGWLT